MRRTFNATSTRQPFFNTMQNNGLRLITLGRLDLVDAIGAAADPSLSTRRRKLALLAVLAVHRRPIARDTLQEYFWGDQPEAKARHSLSDALSHLRRVLGREAIVTTAGSAALAPDAPLSVDALDFVAAVQRSDAAEAIALYEGAFLDGLGKGTSVAFEQWLDGVRAQFDQRFSAACEQRCSQLAEASEWDACVDVATRWQSRDPSSAGAMHFHLRAMAAPGTRDAALAALRSFERYRARLHDEFGLRPDQELADFAQTLADRVRESEAAPGMTEEFSVLLRTGPQRAVSASPPSVAPAEAAATLAASLDAVPETPTVNGPTPRVASTWRRRRTSVAAVAAVVVLSVAGMFVLRQRATATALPSTPLLALTDMRLVRGDSTQLWLTDGLMQLIASALSRSANVEVVAPGRVRDATLRAELDPNRLDFDGALVIARSLGADMLVRSGLVQGDTLLQLDLTVSDARTGVTREVIIAQGSDLVTLASAAAVRLADAAGGSVPGPRVADLETPSAEAYERYMRALRLIDGTSLYGAATELDAAIAIDSGFVSAVIERLGIAAAHDEVDVVQRLHVTLDKYAHRASPWVRITRDANTAKLAGDVRTTVRLLHELVDRYPRDPRAYALLAEQYGHGGDFARAESITLQQLALDSLATTVGRGPCAACSAYGGLRIWRTYAGNLAGARAAAQRLTELQPELPGAWVGLFEAATLLGSYNEADRALARLQQIVGPLDANLRGLNIRMQMVARRFERADSLLAPMERDPDRTTRIIAHDVRAIYWRELGDYQRSNDAMDRWDAEGADPYLAYMVRGNNFGRLGRYADAEREFRTMLARIPDEPPGEAARMRAWVTALLADAIAPTGDTVRLLRLADSVEYWSRRSYYARDARLPHHIRGLVAMQGERWTEARDLFERARWGAHAYTRTNAELARVYDKLGDKTRAEQVRRDALGANLDAMGRYEPRTTFLRELRLSDPAAAAAIKAGVSLR